MANASARAQLASLGAYYRLKYSPLPPKTRSSQPSCPVRMSLTKWKSFPHAYNYINKHPYSPEELKALYGLIKWFSVDTVINSYITTGMHRGLPIVAGLGGPDGINARVYYWEVSINREGHMGYNSVNVGFESHEYRVLYRIDGKIIEMSVSDQVLDYNDPESSGLLARTEEFSQGDVVGCGITGHGNEIFFTKNGRQIAAVNGRRLHSRLCRPCLVIEKSTTFSLNHGDIPFEFDIEAFCDSVIRARRLAGDLPPELFQMIVRQCFDNISDIHDIKAIHRLSTVSRYCYNLCHTLVGVPKTASLTSHREMCAAVSYDIFSRVQQLVTQEDAGNPWLHTLFTRSHPHSATSALVQNWICDYNNCEFRHPMDLDTFARSHHYNSLSRLEILQRRFKSWTQFAKLVFSLPHLEHLTISDVKWDNSPEVPPSWLRFHRRLRSFRCSSYIMGPELWLFIAGRPPTGKEFWGPALLPGEIPVSARILETVMKHCALNIDRLDCEHQADASYILTGFNNYTHFEYLKLTLVPVNESCHRLSHIWLSDHEVRDLGKLHAAIESLASMIPNFETPGIEIGEECAEYQVLFRAVQESISWEELYSPPREDVEEQVLAQIQLNVEMVQINVVIAKALSDIKRVYIKPPPESWGIPVQKRKILQWDTQNKHGRKPTQMKGNVKRG